MHANEDRLSQLPLPKSRDVVVSSREPTIFNLSQIQALPVTAMEIETVTSNDPVLTKVLTYRKNEWPQIMLVVDSIMWRIQVIIPKKFQICVKRTT